jgi:hypothetical protein
MIKEYLGLARHRRRRGSPRTPLNGTTNQLVAECSRLYAEACEEDQLALRVWMRDIILGRKLGRVNLFRASRGEKRMIEARERRILEFPSTMEAREVAKELKREGWYSLSTDWQSLVLRIERVRAKAGT